MITDESRERLRRYLVVAEGLRLSLYWDCCGRSLRADCTKGPTHKGHLSIGIGRNIETVGVSALEAYDLCDHDIDRAVRSLVSRHPWFADEDPVRQTAGVELEFNMGPESFGGFKNTLAAWQRHDYQGVARGLRASRWIRQVQASRSERIIKMVEQGQWV